MLLRNRTEGVCDGLRHIFPAFAMITAMPLAGASTALAGPNDHEPPYYIDQLLGGPKPGPAAFTQPRFEASVQGFLDVMPLAKVETSYSNPFNTYFDSHALKATGIGGGGGIIVDYIYPLSSNISGGFFFEADASGVQIKKDYGASGTSGLQANNYFTGIVGWQTNYQLTANCDFFTRSGVAVADQRYSLISSAGTVNYDFLTPGLSSTVGLAHYFSPADGIPFAPSKIFVDYTYNYFGSYHTERDINTRRFSGYADYRFTPTDQKVAFGFGWNLDRP